MNESRAVERIKELKTSHPGAQQQLLCLECSQNFGL